jgi:hypothetical protein
MLRVKYDGQSASGSGRAGRAAGGARIAPDIGGRSAASPPWPCGCGIVGLVAESMQQRERVMAGLRGAVGWTIHGVRRVKHGMSGMVGRAKCHSRPPGLCLKMASRRAGGPQAASLLHDAIRSVARGLPEPRTVLLCA